MNAFYGLWRMARLKQPRRGAAHGEFQRLKERQKDNLHKADESMMSDTEIFYDGCPSSMRRPLTGDGKIPRWRTCSGGDRPGQQNAVS
jgi:hypothetical protein